MQDEIGKMKEIIQKIKETANRINRYDSWGNEDGEDYDPTLLAELVLKLVEKYDIQPKVHHKKMSKIMKCSEIKNDNGITVPELISFLQSLPAPESKDDTGEVWVETTSSGSISNLCHAAVKLNKNDILLRISKEQK